MLTVFLLITLLLVSAVCYFNFDNNYENIRQSYYLSISSQVINDMETSLNYGKRIDRYYGIENIFDTFKHLLGDNLDCAIYGNEGRMLYNSAANAVFLQENEIIKVIEDIGSEQFFAQVKSDGYQHIVQPIASKDNVIDGYFAFSYKSSIFNSTRIELVKQIGVIIGILLLVGLLLLMLYFLTLRKEGRHELVTDKQRRRKLYGGPYVIIVLLVIMLGVGSYQTYQEYYIEAIEEGTYSMAEYVSAIVDELGYKGVSYEQMNGLDEFLQEKADNMPVLQDIMVEQIEIVSDDAQYSQSNLSVKKPLAINGEKGFAVLVTASQEYIDKKMFNLLLVFIATFIFSFVVIIELMRLPEIIDAKKQNRAKKDDQKQYRTISSGIRITSFFRTMSNYLYLPYSAMLIRHWNQSVFGLSNGLTAALPLALEGAGQILGMLILPKINKYSNAGARTLFVFCLIGIIVINMLCFATMSAFVIIVLRLIGGFLLSGIIHFMNILMTQGSDCNERKEINIVQSNAGIIGGIMCGAGIGALIASLGGYSMTYLASSVVFVIFGIFVLYIMPFKLIDANGKKVKMEHKALKLESREIKRKIKKGFFFPVFKYFLTVIVPVNAAILFIVIIIPFMLQGEQNALMLSFCYIINGIAGFYIGPKLATVFDKRFSFNINMFFAMIVAGASMVVLNFDPILIMIFVSSALLGIFDGFGTPLAASGFLKNSAIKDKITEVRALSIYYTLCSITMMIVPLAIEFILQNDFEIALWGFGLAYVVFASISIVSKQRTQ